jgi:hypothetical protein
MNRRKFINRVSSLCLGSLAAGPLLTARSSLAAPQSPGKAAKSAKLVDGRLDRAALEDSVRLACNWLIDVAQMKTEQLGESDKNTAGFPYDNWKGAFRGEYNSTRDSDSGRLKAKNWTFYCPVWHGGQAVKALSLAYQYFGSAEYLEGAKRGAEFIGRHQNRDKASDDFGCILGYEDFNTTINCSAVLEATDGLFQLSQATGDPQYAGWAVDAIRWAVRRLYKGGGLFTDSYNPVKKTTGPNHWLDKSGAPGRPLIDDGVLLTAWQQSQDETLRRAFYEIADLLIAKEEPAGNWINYAPCNWKTGAIHPRQAFWWGRPMWMAYKDSKDEKYRQCFERACDWYTKAMRRDGGMLRGTYRDFTSDSFGHATSGTACACMMFHDSCVQLGSKKYLPNLALAMKYMMSMQVTKAIDPNMQGVIVEKVLPPNGSDAASWYIRDLGTIFFVTSAVQTLMDIHD